jgi:hypothetical protein
MNTHHCTTCIDLLYFAGCPSYQQVWHDLVEVIADAELDACVRLVNVDTPEKATALHFAGSPTVKVNGHDLEGYAGDGFLACRFYRENDGKGWPSRNLLRRALTRQWKEDDR